MIDRKSYNHLENPKEQDGVNSLMLILVEPFKPDVDCYFILNIEESDLPNTTHYNFDKFKLCKEIHYVSPPVAAI